ncbi:hypothetical protein A4G99_03430 [Haladaptatus sp. R4]|uniref:ZIP family metal transporter n=1 Tax=Haladaptatus sp. R4 TaxID=1679489 RepID=UPI0007B47A61|nr:ZIP family metal transporter [Haladaptatus sp. R4]KZN25537.1 hypothetical protein A4G99_03430 [Haladaptatus sp. R4]
MALTTLETVALGTVAGGTVYLGLPVARFSVSNRTTHILNGGAIGVLLFLLVDILHGALEPVEEAIEVTAETGTLHVALPLALLIGFTGSIVGLAWFNDRYVGSQSNPQTTALMVAVGIGFHNFSEGLAIGQSAATGAISLAAVLIIGFALHNVTEGFGIAAPLTNTESSAFQLVTLGLIAGGPTFLGTIIGQSWTSPAASVLFLALAGGALIYVIQELFCIDRRGLARSVLFSAVAAGFLVGFATELAVYLSMGG